MQVVLTANASWTVWVPARYWKDYVDQVLLPLSVRYRPEARAAETIREGIKNGTHGWQSLPGPRGIPGSNGTQGPAGHVPNATTIALMTGEGQVTTLTLVDGHVVTQGPLKQTQPSQQKEEALSSSDPVADQLAFLGDYMHELERISRNATATKQDTYQRVRELVDKHTVRALDRHFDAPTWSAHQATIDRVVDEITRTTVANLELAKQASSDMDRLFAEFRDLRRLESIQVPPPRIVETVLPRGDATCPHGGVRIELWHPPGGKYESKTRIVCTSAAP